MATGLRTGLKDLGVHNAAKVHWNLSVSALVEHAVRRGEGELAENGALMARTGKFTGRSPRDKYVVRDRLSEPHVEWGTVNQALSADAFDRLHTRLLAYLQGRELFVLDCCAGADPDYSYPIRVVNELAWQNLFARNLFIVPPPEQRRHPEFTILCAPGFQADPSIDRTGSETFIVLNFDRRIVLIGGTSYAGEMKKSIFTALNYLLPFRGVLPMHCSANIGAGGDVALFFGLSGTGKTTLSADGNRRLIGDDEHGWSDNGVFNFEGGCYAKCIRLSREHEPQIWDAIRYGTVLENVVLDEDHQPDYNDDSITENTRAAYPIANIAGAVVPGVGGHPNRVFLLTADAFGVLPPISRLTPDQAMYYFLSGYTAKVAGTERGLGNEPQATFSTCFASPFLPLRPDVYARMLGERLQQHNASVWLVNTGWTGGRFGVGQRVPLPYTRAMVQAALEGALDNAEYRVEPIFGLETPRACPGVPARLLNPREAWHDKNLYDRRAYELAARFEQNFERFVDAPAAARAAGPHADLKAA